MRDKSLYEKALADIELLPPNEQEEALRQLSLAYTDLTKTARDEMDYGFEMATRDMPKGQQAGNNRFSVYVGANPLEHIAAGAEKYMGHKQMKKARGALDDLSADQQSATARMLRSGMGGGGGYGPDGRMTKEEWERRYGMNRSA